MELRMKARHLYGALLYKMSNADFIQISLN
jgi:hypothetical protein